MTCLIKNSTLTVALLCTMPLTGVAQDAVPLDQATLRGDEVIETPAGTIELQDSYFDDEASERLFDTMDLQRAAQAYIWSTPLVSTTGSAVAQSALSWCHSVRYWPL